MTRPHDSAILTSMFDHFWQKYARWIGVAAATVALASTFLFGVLYGYENRPGAEKLVNVFGKTPPPLLNDVDADLLWEVWARLEEKYVDRTRLDRQKLLFGAAQGLVRGIGDPYSEFLPPAQSKQFREDVSGEFGGIGAEIGIRKGVLVVVSPLKQSPAERSGLRAGDRILKIDDTVTADLAVDEAVRMIRGPVGTKVLLAVAGEKNDAVREVTIVRETIKIPILATEKKENGIFVIKLHHFTENAGIEFRKAVREFYQSGSKKLVFDLRGNPGGFLVVSVDIASWFLPVGEVVARERFGDGSEDVYRSEGYGLLERIPTVVLIDHGSASAAEIVAGALRDHKDIPLIGAKTFGKGSVQQVDEFPDKSSLKLTIAKWLTPNGTEIEGKGLEPDIPVEVTEEKREREPDRDFILEKGIEILKAL